MSVKTICQRNIFQFKKFVLEIIKREKITTFRKNSTTFYKILLKEIINCIENETLINKNTCIRNINLCVMHMLRKRKYIFLKFIYYIYLFIHR